MVAPAFLLPSIPAAPVVRTAILYQSELADGRGPAFMLLDDAFTGLVELPAKLDGASPVSIEDPSEQPGG